MRILQLHSNFIVFKPVEKEINIAEEAEKVENRVEEVVVLFTAIEEGDNSAMAQKAVNDVRAFLGKLKVNRILIYPFAHLSSNLSQPSEALKIIKDMEAYAKEKGIETYRAPFGWNKQFTISIKGHPLAEQARSYGPAPAATEAQVPCDSKKEEEPVSAALKAEDTMKSYWHILQTDGSLVPVEEFKFKGHVNLQSFLNTRSKRLVQSPLCCPTCH
jgi:threonyl-tRNA synthetase